MKLSHVAGEIDDASALALAESPPEAWREHIAAAAEARDRAFGRTLTYSPKAFLPLTNLCRDFCDYCSFRRSPGQKGAWTMTPAEVDETLDRAAALGCGEALFCLGDRPETAFPSYVETLRSFGHETTVDYLMAAGRAALERGLLPHTNAGVLDADEMARLKDVNVSLGLMLENISERLMAPGMPHRRAPDKHPALRLQMLEDAGKLGIAFTTGILLGIGENARERVESLLAIRRLHRQYGHIQEVIVQNFRAGEATAMRRAVEPEDPVIAHTIAIARLILDPEVSVQSPPNLNAQSIHGLLAAGVNDFGGISPLTPDYVNPGHAWPHIDVLGDVCARAGFALGPRLPIYERWARAPFLVDGLVEPMAVTRERIFAPRVEMLPPPPPATPPPRAGSHA